MPVFEMMSSAAEPMLTIPTAVHFYSYGPCKARSTGPVDPRVYILNTIVSSVTEGVSECAYQRNEFVNPRNGRTFSGEKKESTVNPCNKDAQ